MEDGGGGEPEPGPGVLSLPPYAWGPLSAAPTPGREAPESRESAEAADEPPLKAFISGGWGLGAGALVALWEPRLGLSLRGHLPGSLVVRFWIARSRQL